MERVTRARTAETPTRPSLFLMLRAPYFYPNFSLAASIRNQFRVARFHRSGFGPKARKGKK